MMKKIIPIIFLISCSDNASLGRVCPIKPCYSGTKETLNVGVCKAGKPICDEKMNVVACDGEVLPSEETCDGNDENCDHSTDNISDISFSTFRQGQYGLINYPCFHLGECSAGYAECVDVNWRCFYPTTVEIENGQVRENETFCDARDGDCDGQTDENLFIGQYCYSGPVGTEFNSPCHPGALRCEYANIICENEVLPTPEICDGQDNDCSGVIDDTFGTLTADYDNVFVVDTSASMAEEIYAVATALNAYAQQFDNNQHYRFALVIMSSPFPNALVKLDTNFTDFQTLRNRIATLQNNGSGLEASLDAIFDVCEPVNPLSLNWRPGSNKMMFVFTDEYPQSYVVPPTTNQMILDVCISSGIFVYVWSQTPGAFNSIIQTLGGHFVLTSDWNIIFQQMNSIIIEMCE